MIRILKIRISLKYLPLFKIYPIEKILDKYMHCSYTFIVSGLQGKRWYFFVWDEDNIDHLSEHRILPMEAEEVFFNRYVITPDKKKHAREDTALMAKQTLEENCV